MISPFVTHEGQVYLIEGWHTKMKGNRRLKMRPLTRKEMEIWRKYHEDYNFEIWAILVPKSERNTKKGKLRG